MIARRVLIYRLGSLGDTIIALPSFRLIAKQFPDAERRVLTVFPVNAEKESPIATILEGTGLVHSYERYAVGTRNPKVLFELYSRISAWKPDVLINLAASRGFLSTARDWCFFRLCGIKTLIGFPFGHSQRTTVLDPLTGLCRHESDHLLDRLKALGTIDPDSRDSWSLDLSDEEKNKSGLLLSPINHMPILSIGMGAKIDSKDWGRGNWKSLLDRLSVLYPNHGLMLVGSKDEHELCEQASSSWDGRRVNLCGALSPRESAAAMEKAQIFIGHDGGPMHLASSAGTPCVAIFSAHDVPGKWFPYGRNHQILYHQTNCFGCLLAVCERHKKKCILSITVEEVLKRISIVLAKGSNHSQALE